MAKGPVSVSEIRPEEIEGQYQQYCFLQAISQTDRVESEIQVPEPSSDTQVILPITQTTLRSPSPQASEGPVEATSPACSHPQGTEKDTSDPSQTATYPSGFGVPHASLLEDSPPVAL